MLTIVLVRADILATVANVLILIVVLGRADILCPIYNYYYDYDYYYYYWLFLLPLALLLLLLLPLLLLLLPLLPLCCCCLCCYCRPTVWRRRGRPHALCRGWRFVVGAAAVNCRALAPPPGKAV